MMNFPELKILDKVANDEKFDQCGYKFYNIYSCNKEFLIVELDWTEVDKKKIDNRVNWYKKYGIKDATKEQALALEQMLGEVNWSECLYPQKYKYVFDKYSRFKMTQSYYDECLHLRNMAINEWTRQRPFDTNVREELLTPAISFVESFFYLVNDAIYIYNSEFKSGNTDNDYFEHSVLLRSLMLFRFWKFQTGGGLLLDKASNFIKRYNDSIRDKFDLEIKPDLIDGVKRIEPFGLVNYYPDREEQLLLLVNQRVRDNKLNGILDYK